MLTEKQKKLKAEFEAVERRRRNDPNYAISDPNFFNAVFASNSANADDARSPSHSCASYATSSSYDSSSSGSGCFE